MKFHRLAITALFGLMSLSPAVYAQSAPGFYATQASGNLIADAVTERELGPSFATYWTRKGIDSAVNGADSCHVRTWAEAKNSIASVDLICDGSPKPLLHEIFTSTGHGGFSMAIADREMGIGQFETLLRLKLNRLKFQAPASAVTVAPWKSLFGNGEGANDVVFRKIKTSKVLEVLPAPSERATAAEAS